MNPIALRLTGLLFVLLGISLLTFTLNYIAPGDKAVIVGQALFPDSMSLPDDVLQDIRDEYHLDAPFVVQYGYWITAVLRGDFGTSYASGASVWDIFVANLGETLALTLTSLTLGLIGAFAFASLAVRNQGTWIDRLAIVVSSIGSAMPNFWLALLLILGVFVYLGWLPAYGEGTLAHLVLPSLTLAFRVMASQTRLLRSFMLDACAQPFVETLRLRGIPEREIFFLHIVPHARIPALTMIGLDLAALLEGAVIVEIVFARSGLGSLLVHAVLSRDLPLMMFLVMFFATAYVFINSAIDLAQSLSDPRTRRPGVAR